MPVLNYLGWMVVVMGVVLGYVRLFPRGGTGSHLPVLLLLSHYLASAGWAVKKRKPGYLFYSALLPVALYPCTRN